jgi:hypothetical protein
MSNYTKKQNVPNNVSAGNIIFDTRQPTGNWIVPDGSLVPQTSHPKLFREIGLLKDSAMTVRSSYTISTPVSVVFGHGRYLVYNATGGTIESYDGSSWATPAHTGSGDTAKYVAYGNGIYVSGSGRGIYTSTSGINWDYGFPVTSLDWDTGNAKGIVYGNGKFVLYGNNEILTSTNGVNWFWRYAQCVSIVFAKDLFVYSQGSSEIVTSTNGTNWTTTTGLETGYLSYGNNVFVHRGNSGSLYTSTNAENWIGVNNGISGQISYSSGTYLNTYYGGNAYYKTSTNLINWSSQTMFSSGRTPAYLYEKFGKFFALSDYNVCVLSEISYSSETNFKLPNISNKNVLNNFDSYIYLKGG